MDFLDKHRIYGSLIIAGLEVIQVIIAVLPSEVLQLASGITFGWLWGSIVIMSGVFVGNQIYFFANKLFRKKIRKTKQYAEIFEDASKKMEKDHLNVALIIFLLYVAPGITYGVIALIAISFNLKWSKFTLFTLLGSALPIFVEVSLSSQVVNTNDTVATIFLSLIMAIVIFFLFFKEDVLKFILRPKRSLDEKIDKFKTKKPSWFIYKFFGAIFNKQVVKKNNAAFIDKADLKNRKEPILFLCNHPSKIDYIYFCLAINPHRPQIIVNRYFYHNNLFRPLLRRAGCIPKKQFQPDVYAMREILKAAKKGRDIAIWPEGMNSYHGACMPILPGIDKLIKKLGMPVVNVKVCGSYLSHGKIRKTKAKGRIELTIENLFSADELKEMSSEEIGQKLSAALDYNDFEWAKENQVEFKADDLSERMDKILYICPHCHAEGQIKSGNNKVECSACGNGVSVNKYYQFEPLDENIPFPANLPAWYKFQQEEESKAVSDLSFTLDDDVQLQMFAGKGGEKTVGVGRLTLNSEGLTYYPADGVQKAFSLSLKERSQISLNVGMGFEFYCGEEFYCVLTSSPLKAVKFTIMFEQAHKKIRNDE